MAKKLTAAAIEKVKPGNARREIPDAGQPGLYLVIHPSGKKSWCVRYRRKSDGKSRKLTLDAGTLTTAHKLARKALDEVADGHDPAAQKQITKQDARARAQDGDGTFGAVARRFILKYAKPKNRSWIEVARLLGLKPDPQDDKELLVIPGGLVSRWGKRRFDEIERKDIVDLLDEIPGVTANRVRAALHKMWTWAAARDDRIVRNPVAGVPRTADEIERDRVLSDDEVRLFWRAADGIGFPFGTAAQLLLLTGQRRGEVGGMQWNELDLDARTWTIPRQRAKNDEEHTVPLSDAALAIIHGVRRVKGQELLFSTTGETPVSGWSRSKQRLGELMLDAARKEAEERGEDPDKVTIAPWRLHDLRRTTASGLARIGVDVATVEKVLNHKSGTFAGIVRVYQRHDFAAEKAAALAAWAREVDRIVTGKSADVITFPAAARGR